MSTSLKWVQATTLGGSGRSAKALRVAHSSPTPSAVSVPLPNSSMMQRDLQHCGDRLASLHNGNVWCPLILEKCAMAAAQDITIADAVAAAGSGQPASPLRAGPEHLCCDPIVPVESTGGRRRPPDPSRSGCIQCLLQCLHYTSMPSRVTPQRPP